jgi:hypothetical protein
MAKLEKYSSDVRSPGGGSYIWEGELSEGSTEMKSLVWSGSMVTATAVLHPLRLLFQERVLSTTHVT